MLAYIRPILVIFMGFAILSGLIYPLAITALGQWIMPAQANGSLIHSGSKVLGSALIGQSFDRPEYFWGRLSATSPQPYNAGNSSGSNLGPRNPALIAQAKTRMALMDSLGYNSAPVPIDLVTASGSGLDPDISPAAAFYQVPRLAQTRELDAARLRDLVSAHIQPRQFGFLGEPRVNVLSLNLALDSLRPIISESNIKR